MGIAAKYAWFARAFRIWAVAEDQEEEPWGDGSRLEGVFGVAGSVKAYSRQAANLDFLQAVALVRLQLLILALLWAYFSAKYRALSGNPGAFSGIPCQTDIWGPNSSNPPSRLAISHLVPPNLGCHIEHLPTR